MDKNLNRHFTKTWIQTANMHVKKKWSIPVFITEIEIKTRMKSTN